MNDEEIKTSERLDGHDAIRRYIDPDMSRSYYFESVVPLIKAILMTKGYSKTNEVKVFTYKNLLQARLLEIEKI